MGSLVPFHSRTAWCAWALDPLAARLAPPSSTTSAIEKALPQRTFTVEPICVLRERQVEYPDSIYTIAAFETCPEVERKMEAHLRTCEDGRIERPRYLVQSGRGRADMASRFLQYATSGGASLIALSAPATRRRRFLGRKHFFDIIVASASIPVLITGTGSPGDIRVLGRDELSQSGGPSRSILHFMERTGASVLVPAPPTPERSAPAGRALARS